MLPNMKRTFFLCHSMYDLLICFGLGHHPAYLLPTPYLPTTNSSNPKFCRRKSLRKSMKAGDIEVTIFGLEVYIKEWSRATPQQPPPPGIYRNKIQISSFYVILVCCSLPLIPPPPMEFWIEKPTIRGREQLVPVHLMINCKLLEYECSTFW